MSLTQLYRPEWVLVSGLICCRAVHAMALHASISGLCYREAIQSAVV